MKRLAEEVIGEAKALGYPLTSLESLEAEKLRSVLADRYGIRSWVRIWESLGKHSSIHNPTAWTWLDEFLGGDEVVMFFDKEDDQSMILLNWGTPVVPVLSECTGFEFYLTNRSGDYLLCFNHHDFLIGVGGADEWVASMFGREGT